MGQNTSTHNAMEFKVNETLEAQMNLPQHISSTYSKDIFTYFSIHSTNT